MKSKTVQKLKPLVIDTETTGLDTFNDKLLGLSYAYEEDGELITGWISDPEEIKQFLEGHKGECFFVAQNGKFDAKFIYNQLGVSVDIGFDTKLAYSLHHIDRDSHLETAVFDTFGVHKKDLIEIYNEETGKERKSFPKDFFEVIPMDKIITYAQEDAEYEHKLMDYCVKKFKKKPELAKWFYEVENPLGNILTKTELQGVKVDIKKLKQLQTQSTNRLEKLSRTIIWLAGDKDLNINSTKQLQEVLYGKLKLPVKKKTKKGSASTDTSTLEKLVGEHAIVKLILEYRMLTKLLTSFISPLIEKADSEDRIHACFNQIGTKTRRFSCQEPNLQQIPSSGDLGTQVRSCFIPSEGYKFLIADYSQIELRILAHFSKDPQLIKAFEQDADLHSYTASLMYDIPIEEVGEKSPERAVGKLLNFSILYGKTCYGFAQDWNCSEEEAQAKIDKWFKAYKGASKYIKDQQLYARSHAGWIKTLAGLPLFVPNVNSSNTYKFEAAMRQAVNFPIQASSQDILKRAVVEIYNSLGLYPLLLVHDELVFEIKDDEKLDDTVKEVVDIMENIWELEVPLKVGYEVADHWKK